MNNETTSAIRTLHTVGEVAEALTISEKHVRRLINSRDLAHVRIGRCVRITPEDLENYIARMRQSRPL